MPATVRPTPKINFSRIYAKDMASSQSRSAFEYVPRTWFEPVVALWVTLLAALGMRLTLSGGREFLYPLGSELWAALVVVTVTGTLAYGVFGVGFAHLYRDARDFDPYELDPFDREEWRLVGGLAVASVLVLILGRVWPMLVGYPTHLGAPLLGIGPLQGPEGLAGLGLELAGANSVLNAAPHVLFVALLSGLLVGPAAAAVFHGVFQDSLARVAHPAVAVGGTALVAAVVLERSAFISTVTFNEAFGAITVFAFVLAVAYAYRETDNLLVAMAAYGLFNVLSLLLAWLSLLARLHAKGHLLG